MLTLDFGLMYLENNDFRLLKEADPVFSEDNLQRFFSQLGVSFISESDFQRLNLAAQYNLVRCACIMALIATESCNNEKSSYGYNISISHTDTMKENVHVCIEGIPILSACEDWEHTGISWTIYYLNPCFANYDDNSRILEAVINTYSG